MSGKVASVAAGAVVLGLVLAGCGGSSSPAQPTGQELRAIHTLRVVQRTAGIAAQFPPAPSSVDCVIAGGGPPPGLRIHGRCATEVQEGGDGVVLVRFTETWNGRDFRGPGSKAMPGLSRTWEFTVTPEGHVEGPLSYGDFPPQFVR